ncbi:MAG: chromosome condensation regulator, partial [Dehalococcoidia bacterium]|nr:chromosome condensation regulator [Dehalococcoidia bacterium]
AGSFHTVGLKSDGTVVALGWNLYGQCEVGDWDLG